MIVNRYLSNETRLPVDTEKQLAIKGNLQKVLTIVSVYKPNSLG